MQFFKVRRFLDFSTTIKFFWAFLQTAILVRLFVGTTVFLCTTLFFRHDFFLGTAVFFGHFFFWHDFFWGTTFLRARLLFSARPGQVTADQYYCSGMEHMVIATVVQILGTRLPCLFLLNMSRHAQFVTSAS